MIKLKDNLLPYDTHKNSALKQIDIYKNMDISTKAEITFQLSNNLRSVVEAGIRQRHPEYTQSEVVQAVLSLVVDKETLDKIFGGREVLP